MVDLTQLALALVDTLQRIPELVEALDDGAPEKVFAYLDSNPSPNSLVKAIYRQPAGTVMVAWDTTGAVSGSQEMSAWAHRYFLTCRAARNSSALVLLTLLVNGVPVPGDTQRWRYCPVMDGVLPATIIEIIRTQDPEGVDYFAVHIEIKETGDA